MTMQKFLWKDKTGRGFTNNNIQTKDILEWEDEEGYIGGDLHEFAKFAEEGDEWENREFKLVCIETNVDLANQD